jgi:hypothetical protein
LSLTSSKQNQELNRTFLIWQTVGSLSLAFENTKLLGHAWGNKPLIPASEKAEKGGLRFGANPGKSLQGHVSKISQAW